jgi:hypothetical protein
MIVTLINNFSTAATVISSAQGLSVQLGKSFGIVVLAETATMVEFRQTELNELLLQQHITPDFSLVQLAGLNDLNDICTNLEVSSLFIQLTNPSYSNIKRYLKVCRELRIPYLFYKDSFSALNMEKVLVPVNFLIEEIEKAQFAAAFGRFCHSKITLLQANDYGSKAATNVSKIKSVFDKFDFEYQVVKGKRDSFKIEFDALIISENENYGLILVSSSREYGLDDVIFGPKELHLIKKAKFPLLLINPRADLYTLCD